jgi:hypothetical protein
MKYLLILLLIGCLYVPKQTWSAVLCDNLICFPRIVELKGVFNTRTECREAIKGKTDPEKMEFYYCQGS